jgi:hypothetical protein
MTTAANYERSQLLSKEKTLEIKEKKQEAELQEKLKREAALKQAELDLEAIERFKKRRQKEAKKAPRY